MLYEAKTTLKALSRSNQACICQTPISFPLLFHIHYFPDLIPLNMHHTLILLRDTHGEETDNIAKAGMTFLACRWGCVARCDVSYAWHASTHSFSNSIPRFTILVAVSGQVYILIIIIMILMIEQHALQCIGSGGMPSPRQAQVSIKHLSLMTMIAIGIHRVTEYCRASHLNDVRSPRFLAKIQLRCSAFWGPTLD